MTKLSILKFTIFFSALMLLSSCAVNPVNPRITQTIEYGGFIEVDNLFNSMPSVKALARSNCESKGLVGPVDDFNLDHPLSPKRLPNEKKFRFYCEPPTVKKIVTNEIPGIVKQDPNSIQWNWTYYYMNPNSQIGFMTDFTKQIKTNNGVIFLPRVEWDLKQKKFENNLYWNRIDCMKDSSDAIGSFYNGNFNLMHPEVYSDESVGAIPKKMICGITNQQGEKIYGLLTTLTDGGLTWWGYIPDEIKFQDVDDKSIKFNLYAYDIVTKQSHNSHAFTADCENKLIKNHSQKNQELDLKITKNAHFIYVFETLCSVKDKLLIQKTNTIKTPKTEQNIELKNQDTKKLSIQEAKSKCIELGFKAKTEKFGECVLELTK